jgi:uncharacterized membrane protein YeaQ/YmgE (transglycosylase-associated protein family)
MFSILAWVVFGLIVGTIAKSLHSGPEPIGWLPTIGLGIAGSFMGGFIHSLLGGSIHLFQPSGLIWSVIGGIVCCYIYSYSKSN